MSEIPKDFTDKVMFMLEDEWSSNMKEFSSSFNEFSSQTGLSPDHFDLLCEKLCEMRKMKTMVNVVSKTIFKTLVLKALIEETFE